MRSRLVALAIAALTLAGAGSASAFQGEGFTVSDRTPTVKREFGPVLLFSPGGAAADPSLNDCQTGAQAIAVPVTLTFSDDFGTVVDFTVSWPGAGGNDLDIYLFDATGQLVASKGTEANPEKMSFPSPVNGTYWVCAVNFLGPPVNFTLEAKSSKLKFFTPTSPPTTPSRTATPKPELKPLPTTTVAVPVLTAEPVETPGLDRAGARRGLLSVAAGGQAELPEDGPGATAIAFGVLTGLIALGGVTIVALRIRRDARPD